MGNCCGDPRNQPQCCQRNCCRVCSWKGRGCCPCCRHFECCNCCTLSPKGDRGLAVSAELHQVQVEARCCAVCAKGSTVRGGTRPLKPPKAQVARLRIIMLIVGSRGDVQPFVAFAMGLRRHGHTVCIASHTKSFSWAAPTCTAEGIEFIDIGGNPEVLMQFAVEHPNLISFSISRVRQQQEIMYDIFCGCFDACEKFRPDVIVSNPPVQVHTMLAEHFVTPLQIHFTMPWTPTNAYAHPCAPGAGVVGNLQSYHLVDEIQWVGLKSYINDFRAQKLELPPIQVRGAGLQHKMELPHLYCASPLLMPKPTDWGPHCSVVGFWNLPQGCDEFGPGNRDWDQGLADFLAGSKREDLIYIGFGSIQCDDPRELGAAVMKGIELVRQKRPSLRVLLSPGWAGIGESYHKVALYVNDVDDLGFVMNGTSITELIPGSIAAGATLPPECADAFQGGKVDGVPRTRIMRMGIGDDKKERVYSEQDVEEQLAKLRARIQEAVKKGQASPRKTGSSARRSAPPTPTTPRDDSPEGLQGSSLRSPGSTQDLNATAPRANEQQLSAPASPLKSHTVAPRHSLTISSPASPQKAVTQMVRQRSTGQGPSVKLRLELATTVARPGVYLVGRCPHDWLFPKCRAVVHHGGAGTTATGLQAACCTLVVPFFGDQPFWGGCCHRQGVGPKPIPVKEITGQKLAAAIELMLGVPGDAKKQVATEQMWQKVAELSAALKAEDGVGTGIQAFHHMLDLDAASLGLQVWQNQVLTGGKWCPSDSASGWHPWSDRTGWLTFHRKEGADLHTPPSDDELKLGEGWEAGEWKVWSTEQVRQEAGVPLPLDPEGWQYAFNFHKQATSPIWHGSQQSNDAVRRRRWTIRKKRMPPLLFLRPGNQHRELAGYYAYKGASRWQQLPNPDGPLPKKKRNVPFGEEAEITPRGDRWVVSAGGSDVLVSLPYCLLPNLVPVGGWNFAEALPSETAPDDGTATVVTNTSMGGTRHRGDSGATVYEPVQFKEGEVCERVAYEAQPQRQRRKAPPVAQWSRVVVVRRDDLPSHYWVRAEKQAGAAEEKVEAMQLRRPKCATRREDGADYSRQGWVPSLDAVRKAEEMDEDELQRGATEEDQDLQMEALLDAADDGAQTLLAALVSTTDKATVQRVVEELTGPTHGLAEDPMAHLSIDQAPVVESFDMDMIQRDVANAHALSSPSAAHRSGVSGAHFRTTSDIGESFQLGAHTMRTPQTGRLRAKSIAVARERLLPRSSSLRAMERRQSTGHGLLSARSRSMRGSDVQRITSARDACMLMLETGVMGRNRVLQTKGRMPVRVQPSSQARPAGPPLQEGSTIIVQQVVPEGDTVWGRIRDPSGGEGYVWTDVTDLLGTEAEAIEGDEVQTEDSPSRGAVTPPPACIG